MALTGVRIKDPAHVLPSIMQRSQVSQAMSGAMKKIRTHTKGDLLSPPGTTKQGPGHADQGMNHVHYDLSPLRAQPDTSGTFDVATKRRIDSKQKKEMSR